jgi:hypothetical protein
MKKRASPVCVSPATRYFLATGSRPVHHGALRFGLRASGHVPTASHEQTPQFVLFA